MKFVRMAVKRHLSCLTLATWKQVAKGAQEAIDVWGSVDVLVNNAGTNRPKPALELTEEDWDAIYDLNLKGLFFLTQTLVKPMDRTGESGKIINISSTMGLVGGPLRTAYSGSKGGVVLLTKGLAVEWGTAQCHRECRGTGVHPYPACRCPFTTQGIL